MLAAAQDQALPTNAVKAKLENRLSAQNAGCARVRRNQQATKFVNVQCWLRKNILKDLQSWTKLLEKMFSLMRTA